MDDYVETLQGFKELIAIDISEYVNDAQQRFFVGETMNMSDLCALARRHALDSDAVFYQLPSSVNLGLVMIDCKSVKTMLAAKHKSISSKVVVCIVYRLIIIS
jgi:hypothetical protein